jgi:DNA repair protein RecN (Recombination protein N)
LIEILRIWDLAIVDRAEIEFGRGLNVFTGETGAGKSIVLGALALLAGARAAASAVRAGCEEASVEALFQTQELADLEEELARRGLAGDQHELVVRRTLGRSGRSRARLSGQLVPAAVLAELFAGRIEISSQHDSHALLRAETQGRLLDHKGGLLELRGAVGEGHRRLRELDTERARLAERERERAQRRDFLVFQVGEIDEAKLDPAEIEELRTVRERLAHVERLRAKGGGALELLTGDPGSAGSDRAADVLAEVARTLSDLGRVDPTLTPFGERVGAAATEVRDVAADLERHLNGIEADPARLAAIDERLHRVEQLQRKYGASVEEVLRHRDQAAAELAEIDDRRSRTPELRGAPGGGRPRAQRRTRTSGEAAGPRGRILLARTGHAERPLRGGVLRVARRGRPALWSVGQRDGRIRLLRPSR